jgi:hypothetical protein
MTQLFPELRHSLVAWQTSALEAFPLPRHLEELLLPKLVVRETRLQFDENKRMSAVISIAPSDFCLER